MKNKTIWTLILSVLILSTSVFAQTKLDPKIYDENGFRLDQNIPKPGTNSSSTVFSTTTDPEIQENPPIDLTPFKQGEPASCFDYYTFGSIGVNMQTDTSKYEAGSPVLIRGQITNNNRYPLTNLTIRARLVRDIPNPVYMRSEIITVDDFNIAENITLNASGTLDINHSHLLPLNAPQGEYKLFFYAYNNDRFNQAGLSFTNDIVASRISFNVTGGNPQQIYLDQTNITLNDQIHNVMAFMTKHEKDKTVNISIPLVNPSNQPEVMNITYTLYKWDGLRKENIVDTKTETINVPAKSKTQLTYTTNKTDTSVYFLNITADNQNQKRDKSVYNIKTESNIRFIVNGYDFARINSFGVDTYPIKAGQEVTLFTCYHNGSNQETMNPVNISTILYNEKGKVITQTEYDGKIDGAISAIIKKFTIKKDLVNFKIVTTIKDNTGNVIDTIESDYNCKDIDSTLCPAPVNYTWMWFALGGLLMLIGIVFSVRKIRGKKINNI
jgi:hypothetical protein